MANKPDKKEIEEAMIASEKINLGLLESHFHFLTGDIEEDNIADTIRWIIYENLKPEPNKVLTLMINSNGGDLTSAIALIDVMKNSNVPIRTIGVGAVISAAFLSLQLEQKVKDLLVETLVSCATNIPLMQKVSITTSKHMQKRWN